MCSCSHAVGVNWRWWYYYLSSKPILSVLVRVGRLHFTLLVGMSLVLITKECICVCLCKLGICTIFRLPDFKHDSAVVLSAFIYVICCYGNMYSLVSLPNSFLASLLMEVCSTPLLLLCLSWNCSTLVCTRAGRQRYCCVYCEDVARAEEARRDHVMHFELAVSELLSIGCCNCTAKSVKWISVVADLDTRLCLGAVCLIEQPWWLCLKLLYTKGVLLGSKRTCNFL